MPNKRWWMIPTGETFPITGLYVDHANWAKQYFIKRGEKVPVLPVEELFKRGWLRLTADEERLFFDYNKDYPPSDKMMQNIKHFAMEMKYKELVNGVTKQHTTLLNEMMMNKKELKQLIKEIISVVLNEASLRGEWWFQDGQAIYADGDVGDVNHEGYVLNILKSQLLETLGVDASKYEYAPHFYDVADQIYENISNELTEEEKEQWAEGTNADVSEIVTNYLERKGDTETKEILRYLTASSLDAREYALVHWGWQRVKMNVIQTQTLTQRDLQNITNGLYEAYSDELEETDEERITETNPMGEHTFNIEVMSTRSYYTDIPWSVLKKDDPTALNGYRGRY